MRTMRAFLRRADGVAATEAAMIMPILLGLLLAGFDVGLANTSRMQLDHGLRAGAQIAMLNVQDTTTVEAAALAALDETQNGTIGADGMCASGRICVRATYACACGATASACTSLCTATNKPPSAFLTITGSRRYEGVFTGDKPVSASIKVQTR